MGNTNIPLIWRHQHQAWNLNRATGTTGTFSAVDQNVTEVPWATQIVRSNNPGWKDKVVRGQNASSSYSRRETSFKIVEARASNYWHSIYSPSNKYQGFSNLRILRGLPTTDVADATLRDQALARVKRRINNMTETYQSLIPLAELRELRGLVGSLTGITTDTVKMIADLKRTKGRSLFSHVSKLWLTYSFGVRPMMADIRDLSNSIWAYLTSGDKKSKVTGTASKEWFTQGTWAATTGGQHMPARYRAMTTSYLSYRFTGAWSFNIRSANDYSALAHFGVTPPALIPALWETTMFSWVADYFGTLGDFLEDQFIGQAGQSVYFVENRIYRATSNVLIEHELNLSDPGIVNAWVYNIPGSNVINHFEFTRTPLSSLPSRILRWKTMDEMGLNGVTKLLNLTAVLLSKK